MGNDDTASKALVKLICDTGFIEERIKNALAMTLRESSKGVFLIKFFVFMMNNLV